MQPILFLGLPTREQVRNQLAAVLEPAHMLRIKWIRVADQVRGLERGSVLYMLADGVDLLASDEHRELDRAIAERGIRTADVSPAVLAQAIAAGRA